MKKKMKINVSRKTIFVVLVAIVLVSFSFKSKFFEVAKQIEIYNTLFKELNMYYVDEINPADLTDKVIKNTLKDLDPYTNFYNEQDVEDVRIRREGEYGGIGVSVNYDKRGIEIREVYKGFSADKAGLKAGDVITVIDNQSIENMNRDQLFSFLKGTPNSTFSVKIDRQGSLITKEITRDKVIINPVPFSEMIDEETGYIVLTRFNEKASTEVKKAFKALKEKGMQKLILDLRSNPGGSLLESINICNFFLPKGKTIVTTKAKIKKWSNTYRTTNKPLDLEIPIVVLVNGRSASASEIVSGSLQDYDRAVIMGQRSFGKGLVQRYRKLTYGTQLKVTISKYYTPSGRCIQELDYTNRKKDGTVPKFSDLGINEFKTQNGRIVFDGGGILPDVITKESTKTKATEVLVNSSAIFNFATDYYYKNPDLAVGDSYDFKDEDFVKFTNFLKTDTSFVTQQEKLFKEAYEITSSKKITKEYAKIKSILFDAKIAEISKNDDILKKVIREEILHRYVYEEGVYRYNLKKDQTITEAVALLQNQHEYKKLLSAK